MSIFHRLNSLLNLELDMKMPDRSDPKGAALFSRTGEEHSHLIPPHVIRLIGGLAIGATLSFGLAGCGFNNIPTKEANAKEKWAQIENEYARRSELIPQLVATVKGAAAHEKDTLTQVVEARAKATSINVDASTVTDPGKFKQFQQAQDGLSSALGRLMVIQEQYPNLKANDNFLTLQSQLEGTANRITIARKDYNEAAKVYNLSLITFPSLVWASTLQGGHKPMEFFTPPAGSAVAPNVDFSAPSDAPAPK